MVKRLLLSLGIALGILFACGGMVQAAGPQSDPPSLPTSIDPLLGMTYAQVINGPTPVYGQPGDAAPTRIIANGFVFINMSGARLIEAAGQRWYQISSGEYIPAKDLLPYAPSKFHGLTWYVPPQEPFAWVVANTRTSTSPGLDPGKNATLLTRYQLVVIHDEQTVNGAKWYRVGDTDWISQYRVGVVKPSARPNGVGPNDKWIEINLYEQTLAAYQGDQLQYATLVSTGLPQWDTAAGLFRIWAKVKQTPMSGREGAPDYYYLEDVPWTEYFNNDTALHAAYWHDGFGAEHSHGCVNLAPYDAMWLYKWTTPTSTGTMWTMPTQDDPGTWVWVHY